MPFTKRDLFIAGLFLYWGEGAKTTPAQISLSNTNPAIIKFFIKWLTKVLDVSSDKIKIRLQLYSDMIVIKEINFWSKELSISKAQFKKPYIKTSSSSSITYKRGFGHGTCNIIIGNVRLMEKIMINLKIIEDWLNK